MENSWVMAGYRYESQLFTCAAQALELVVILLFPLQGFPWAFKDSNQPKKVFSLLSLWKSCFISRPIT